MFASIKHRAITMSRLAIPESSDQLRPPSRPAQANVRFREFFRVQERAVGSGAVVPQGFIPG